MQTFSNPYLSKPFKKYVYCLLLFLFISVVAKPNSVYKVGSVASFPSENSESSVNNQNNETINNIDNEIQYIHNLAQRVKDEGRLLDRIESLTTVEYPIGISGKSDDLNYAIVLDHDYITTEGAFLTAYMSFEIPQNGKKLAFKAENIPLTASGGIAGDVKLALVQDEDVSLGDNITLTIQGDDKSYITFDCSGFKNLTIDALIKFNSEFFTLEDRETGKTIDGQEMSTGFITTVYDWNDLIVEINIPPFQVSPLKGFGFEVNTAVFDMSDYANSSSMAFPEGYESPYTDAALDKLWQGIFIKEVAIRTPPELKNGERISIKANDLIIDYSGFSGILSANELITLEEGSLGGWAFSLDKIEASIIQNSLTEGGLAGKIQMPIMDDTSTIAYEAHVDQKGDFFFTASMPKDIKVDVWKANMQIDKTSTITIEKLEDQYVPTATLNGSISINAPIGSDDKEKSSDSKGFSVSGLTFQELTLSTKNPNFKLGTWSLNEIGFSSDKLNGFSLTLSNIETIEKSEFEKGIKFTAKVSMMKDKYAAAAKLSVLGIMAYENSEGEIARQKWKYNTTQVHSIYLKAECAISITGYFEIYRGDKVFGNGVLGKVSVKLPAIDVEILATAQFGNVSGVRYWYVDAFVNLQNRPISLGSMALYGLGGGAYHHMRQEAFDDVVLGSIEGGDASESDVGSSNSGIGYVPDQSTFLGFKATVVVGTAGSPEPFNADVTFEVTFSHGMGIKTIALYGNGYLMSKLEYGKPNRTAPVYCSVYIGYDFDNKVLHGNFKVYMNVAGGIITGINPGNLAGEMVIHYDKNDWYIHIGRPASRVGLKIDLGFMTIENGSYFMIGTVVDPMPPPPDKVLDILEMDYTPNRDLDDMFTGKGFAFGSSFKISTGDLNLLMFYASFELGLGFDVNLGNYGDAYCVETGRQIGINGWYAQGQAYAYIEGEIGIRVKVFTINIDAKILEIGAAALLQAKLPNPFWMSGAVGGYYSILGGKVSGKCNFSFEVGNQCTVAKAEEESSAVQALQVISELTPKDGEERVDVFNAPQAVFNYPINESFDIPVENDKTQSFRVILDKFDMLDEQGNSIAGTYEWNSSNDVVAFNSHDILPGETKIYLKVQVSFEEKLGGSWKQVVVNGETVIETMDYSFTTGEAPDYIPTNNVAYNYPLFDQVNFYKDEFNTGYVQLNKGQAYLFNPGDDWIQKGRFTPVSGGDPIEFNFSYNSGEKYLSYTIPAGMSNNTVYQFDLVNKPANAASSIDANVSTTAQTSESGDGNTVEMQRKQATGTLNILQEKSLFTSHFRTSMYNTFSQKINSFRDWRNYSYNMYAGVDRIGKNYYADELFDNYETDSSKYSAALIQSEATGNNWLSNRIIPLIYEDYPVIPSATITWRSTDKLGVIPLTAIVKQQDYTPGLLTQSEKQTGSIVARNGRGVFIYYLAYYAYYDYFDMRDNLCASSISNTRINTMLSTTFPTIQIGIKYPIKVMYVLPGINKVTTTETIEIEL